MVPPSAGAEAKSAKKLSSFDDGTTEAGGAWKGCDVSVAPAGPENKSTKSEPLEDTVDWATLETGFSDLLFVMSNFPKFAAAPRSIVLDGLDCSFGVGFLEESGLLVLSLSFSSSASSASSSSLKEIVQEVKF